LNKSVGWSVVPTGDGYCFCCRTITGHAGLAGNTSGDDDNLSALEGIGETGGGGIVALDLLVCQPTRRTMSSQGSRTSLLVLMWPMSAATPIRIHYYMYRRRGGRLKPTGS
jgi:hypothetical protein